MKNGVVLVFLFIIAFIILAVEWDVIIDYVDKITKNVGLKTPAYLLTILEKESSFTKNIGDNTGSREKNIQRCVDYCEELKLKNIYGVGCNNFEVRKKWCEDQYKTLERIVNKLGLDINKVPFAKDFGIGYAQFQPTTWESYPELKNKNPWNLEDSIYAAAIKLLKDGIHNNERLAIGRYNGDPEYIKKFIESRQEWDGIISDTIFVFDCKENDFSCGLAKLKTEYDDCTENNRPIREKKECIKKKVTLLKQNKILALENKKTNLSNSNINNSKLTALSLGNKENSNSEKTDSKINTPKQNESLSNKTEENPFSYYFEETRINRNPSTPSNLKKIKKSEKHLTTSKDQLNQPSFNLSLTSTLALLNQELNKKFEENNFSNTNNLDDGSFYFNNNNQILNNSQNKKDVCEDYKNKNYPKIIISEIKFGLRGETEDEYIELYNPNEEEIDLTCWQLEKYGAKEKPTSTPELKILIPSSKFVGKIKPFSFFLITSSSTKEKYQGDLSYPESYYISNNNVIILRKPNGEISDLVGYGDNFEKIFQLENSPFISPLTCYSNRSIQRKNFQDSDNNSKDFWLRKFSPSNSLVSQSPRTDFFDLSEITSNYFFIFVTSTEEKDYLTLEFHKPLLNTTSTNYTYNIFFSTTSDRFLKDNCGFYFSESSLFTLKDFGIEDNLPSPKFDNSTTTLTFLINKCPTTSTKYYAGLFLSDLLDEDNKVLISTSSIEFPDYLCDKQIVSTSTSKVKILISEVRVIEGSSEGEFIELYNPNTSTVDLSGWKLIRYPEQENDSFKTIVSDRAKAKFKGIIMQPFGYLLLSNTSTLFINEEQIKVDLIYAESHDLAKKDRLVLLNNNGEMIDEFFWDDVSGEKSYTRKKINLTNEENYFLEFTDWGNGYDDINNDFILVNPNPENSSITKEVPKEIYPFDIQFSTKEESGSLEKITISWISPAFYESDKNNYSYKILISTSTEENPPKESFYPLENFATFDLPPFKLLSLQEITIDNLDYKALGLEDNFEFSLLVFKLELYKNEDKINEFIFRYIQMF